MSFTLTDLSQLVLDRSISAIKATSDMVPAYGRGSRISPATYGDIGVALTENSILKRIGASGRAEVVLDDAGRAVTGPVAIVDSTASSATRAENALWRLREELDLPGIVFTCQDEELIAEAVKLALKKLAKNIDPANRPDTPEAVDELVAAVAYAIDPTKAAVSSWTLPHRHVDGAVRHGLLAGTDDRVWDGHGNLYHRLSTAGPRALRELMLLSPNSVLHGFWLSSGAPVAHKLPRSVTTDVVAYDAHRMKYGATQMAVWEAHANVLTDADGEVFIGKSQKGFKKPSELNISGVPSTAANMITAGDIIGTSTLSVGHLRRVFATSADMDDHQRDAATVALSALAILGRLLTLEDGFLRSNCDLVDESTVWESLGRGGAGDLLDLPTTSAEFMPVVADALDDARELGVFGSSADRACVEMSPRQRNLHVTSYVQLSTAADRIAAEGEG